MAVERKGLKWSLFNEMAADSFPRSKCSNKLNKGAGSPGLPDGIFSNRKFQFG
jgi:hypothetical protein